jgi:hypothetical protein
MAEWEAKITLYRNGRRVHFNDAHGESPTAALYTAHNDIELWAEAHPESDSNSERRG